MSISVGDPDLLTFSNVAPRIYNIGTEQFSSYSVFRRRNISDDLRGSKETKQYMLGESEFSEAVVALWHSIANDQPPIRMESKSFQRDDVQFPFRLGEGLHP
jgi:hypothetical protein